ncbi:uncharacterized protein AC631_02667 [Debaryomyces fabryi]|uniref:Uncharacterized protein n=1 Tax=Debaryomyces fabryi TaxID=58627 RepID=A0A0V1PZ93_9ASCO|nr:uncharacterized protein AC631_02667 [Debaryomyces fabryi]KSA01592.1 hypothetical protein AC631_02667 [Debaryomyces fabryi]
MKDNSSPKTTSISEKYDRKQYSTLYELYHDIKVVASSRIQKHKVGSAKYKDIDFFYKFTTELFLRESSRLSLALFHTKKEEDDVLEPSELETQLSEDFNKISMSYNLTNGEVITFIYKSEEPSNSISTLPNAYHSPYPQPQQPPHQIKQPLFSSLTGKSNLDPRSTIVPDPFLLSKVIPLNRNATRNNSTLESLSPSISKIPPPTTQHTEILSNFFHPNWYTIHVPTWLTYKSKTLKPQVASSLLKNQREDELRLVTRNDGSVMSFAPTVDLKVSVVSTELKGNIWLNHLGFQQIHDIKKKYLENINNNTGMDVDVVPDGEDKNNEDDVKPTVSGDKGDIEMKDSNDKDADSLERKEINVADLVQWDPSKIEELESIKEDKETITKSPRDLQKLISTNLLKLNKLRQERYLRSNPTNLLAPSKNEIKLYNKVSKLITLSIELNNVNTGSLDLSFSKRLPVLMSEYAGTLPGLPPSKSVGTTGKSTRLPSIRGPYKKKNRH